jgi:hypothetical protein
MYSSKKDERLGVRNRKQVDTERRELVLEVKSDASRKLGSW